MEYQEQVIKAIQKALPAVVNIAITKELETIEKEFPLGLFGFDPRIREELKIHLKEAPHDEMGRIKLGGGSGFIVSSDGLIITNRHVVIDPKANYSVIASDGKKYEAKILAQDPTSDVAIIKINAKDLPTIELGQRSRLKLGQTALAIGYALGEFQNTVSTGIISGLSRFISAATDLSGHQQKLKGLIQTDAAINPGNSGGPLVNLEGRVIGINVAIVFGAQNIGFAIPIERAIRDLEEIKRYSRIRRPFFGIRYVLISPEMKSWLKLPFDYGALIAGDGIPQNKPIIPKSAADEAGIKEGDIIISINKKRINFENSIEDAISEAKVGDKIEIEIYRKGKITKKQIQLKEYQE
ncbi:MAG: hypothetical protein A3H02_00700 [Candidatus Niyogibacteria bacterium RIFCSPLOWO2_12_FULL_41_13]|uniref:PDZ domain-containing protein n=1 Tax=Candidatus Niyogibacteria bacterium RIFCSPLOWO2_12_FULL_41_13 TaxID=1801726 RepID=A0A1G2F2E0_9BACT|nr:MAG: hypothetical protein A3H02_00700 [Candidatus Niyogibacteria bacterium RIFCSPLOWO2_12_FULL_41_13]